MFLGFHSFNSIQLQNTVLIINTALIIVVLITFELVYSGAPKSKRKNLRYLYPILVILFVILCYAIYAQAKVA